MTHNEYIKEVTLYTMGDSTKLSTWSNVPFLFAKALENKGIKVNRINIEENMTISKVYNKYFIHVINFLYKRNDFSYQRSLLNVFLINRKIKKTSNQYPNSQLNIFLTFTYYNKWSDKPSILFGDWTYDYLFQKRIKRKPYSIEQRFIDIENNSINKADMVVCLFPKCCEFIKSRSSNKNIFYLGRNVVNNINEHEPSEQLIPSKRANKRLLFVGGGKYSTAAETLISAYKILKTQYYPDLQLDLIGLKEDFNKKDNHIDGVHFYGYLNKTIDSDRKLYYDLFSKASILINTTPQWAGYSSTIEAMYYYTPVVVTKYEDFTSEFGEELDFGLYSENSVDAVVDKIKHILDDRYEDFSLNAHNAVKDYTWDKYMENLLNKVELYVKSK